MSSRGPRSGAHDSWAGGGSGRSDILCFAGRRRLARSRHPIFNRTWTARSRAGPCVLQGGGAWSKAGLPRFMGQRWLGLRWGPIFCRVARVCTWRIRVRIRAGTPFPRSPVHELHFPKWLRKRIRPGNIFLQAAGAPVPTVQTGSMPDPPRLPRFWHRIHVDPCGGSMSISHFLYVEKGSATALIKILIKAAADPDPGAIGARRGTLFRISMGGRGVLPPQSGLG